ncbi:MAG: DUF3794 domain-containing protein [Clostridiales bacterium]|nr:DUF3794 domain-containing protein [Clostridiales bacterium]
MPIDLIKETLVTEVVVSQERVQNVIEGDILVPDSKPDISRIISVDGTIRVEGEKIEEGKMIVEGTVNFSVLYVSEVGEEAIINVESSTVFKHEIELESVAPKMQGEVKAEIEHIDFSMNNERKIGIKAIVNLKCKVKEKRSAEIITSTDGFEDLQVLKERFQYISTAEKRSEEILVKDAFEIEDNLPEIEEIVKTNWGISNKETKITDKKIIVGGILLIDVVYLTDDSEDMMRSYKAEIPFNNFVEMSEANCEAKYKSIIRVNTMAAKIIENIQGERRIIEIEAFVQVDAEIVKNVEKELIVDVYSHKKKLAVERNTVLFKKNIETEETSVSLNESLNVPLNNPRIEKILFVNARTSISDYHEIGKKIVIEGVLGIVMIYMSESEVQSLHRFEQEIPFKQYIGLGGAYEGIKADIELSDASVKYEVVGENQGDVKVDFKIECEAYVLEKVELIGEITELEQSENSDNGPSLIIYVIQSGDTLWKIAKKYNSTMENIIENNNIENPDELSANEYILSQNEHTLKL